MFSFNYRDDVFGRGVSRRPLNLFHVQIQEKDTTKVPIHNAHSLQNFLNSKNKF